jgi:hypothetical protein
MSEESWEIVAEVYGEIQAELLRGLLEAQGIPVTLNQEGAGRAYGINVGPLGMVQIMVPSHLGPEARQVLEDYQSGKFSENGGDQPAEAPGE